MIDRLTPWLIVALLALGCFAVMAIAAEDPEPVDAGSYVMLAGAY